MMINYKKSIVVCCLAIAAMTTFNACKKYTNAPQVFEEYGDDMDGKADRKVLIINISGLSGQELERAQTANITELLKTSKYNFSVLPDANPATAPTLVSMFTGVASVKHLISDDSYMGKPLDAEDHDPIIKYPTMFARMLDVRPEFKTVTITPDQNLSKYLIHADHRIVASSDVAVKDSAVNILNTDARSKVIVADFRDVEATGLSVGYSVDAPAYKAAVDAADAHVGALVAAVKARKNYAKEDWLIIVTTNRGGAADNPKPGFVVAHNPNLESEELEKAGFNSMRFQGANTTAVIRDDKGLYDPSVDKDFTVQLQVKFNNAAIYPGFFSRGTDVHQHQTTGWVLIYNGNNWELMIGGQNNGGSSYSIRGGAVGGGGWHTITFTVKTVNGVRTATQYTNGVKNNTVNITGSKTLSTTEPFKIGYRNQDNGGTGLDFFAADIQYFNVALDDATIAANLALKDITKHPQYNNLIGYWPVDDGGGAIISNLAPTGYNFVMTGSGTWQSLANDIPVSRERQAIDDGVTSIVNTGPDVASLTYYWLKVPVKSDWGLDGVNWMSNFELEFIK